MTINQCDGCRRGLQINQNGIHVDGSDPFDAIGCTKDRYTTPPGTVLGEDKALYDLLRAYARASVYEEPYARKRIESYVSTAVQEAIEHAAVWLRANQRHVVRAEDRYVYIPDDEPFRRYPNLSSLISAEILQEKKT